MKNVGCSTNGRVPPESVAARARRLRGAPRRVHPAEVARAAHGDRRRVRRRSRPSGRATTRTSSATRCSTAAPRASPRSRTRGSSRSIEPLLGDDCHVIANTAWRNPPEFPGGVVALRRRAARSRGPRACRGTTASRIRCSRSARTSMLQDCTRADGPTAVVPGSHRSGRLAPFDRMHDEDLTYDGRPPVRPRGDAGDVSLFVSDAWHRGLPAGTGGRGPLLPAGALRPARHRAAHPHDRRGQPPLARSDRTRRHRPRADRRRPARRRSSTTARARAARAAP